MDPRNARDRDTETIRALARVGATFGGRYRLEQLIGMGGMAAVYAGAGRAGPVAIKVLHERLSHGVDMQRRFRREALLANQIDHPGVVRVLDDGVSDDGSSFLVMPLLTGESLRARARRLGGTLSIHETLVVALSVLGTLEAAHAKGVVHRDIKPENLFVTTDGDVKVLDFGIARLLCADSPSATTSGHAIGTPSFMAPEQALGRLRQIDARTDLWALGATMFTLLAGRAVHPSESASEALILAGTRAAPPIGEVVPELAAELAAVIDRALAFERDARWADAPAMTLALREAYASSTGAQPASSAPRLSPKSGAVTSDTEPAPLSTQVSAEPSPDADELAGPANTTAPNFAVSGAKRLSLPPGAGRRALVGSFALAAGAAAVLGGLGWRHEVTARDARPPAVASTAASAPGAHDSLYLGPWRTAWLDGDAARVRDEATRALEVDPSDARAHLAYVVGAHFWPDPAARAHFSRAVQLRDRLEPPEVAYIDAIAPGMSVPPDFREAITRLTTLLDASPSDIVVRMALSDMMLRTGDLDGPAKLLGSVVNGPRPPGLALSRYAHLAAARDDIDTARAYFRRCLEGNPGAQVCAEPLADLEMNEGRCADAERVLRRQLSISPDATAYQNLAYVLERQGATADEVAPVLDNWVQASPDAERAQEELRAKVQISLIKGQLHQALGAYDELGTLLAKVQDDPAHFYYTRSRMALEAELGDTKAAAKTLSQYEATRNAFQRDIGGEDNVSYLQAVGAELGVVPWSTWTVLRDARLAHPTEVDDQLDGRARSWLQHFAIPTTTREAAEEALGALATYPLLSRADRDYAQDAAIGRVYGLAGRDADALPYAERAAHSCYALDDLVQFHRAELDLGDLYAHSGSVDRACATYQAVINQWPARSGAVTSRRAAERMARLCNGPAASREE